MLILFDKFYLKKKLITLLSAIFFLLNSNILFAKEYGCNNNNFENYNEIFNIIPKKIIIKVDQNRKWQVNNQKIILDLIRKKGKSSKFTDAYIDPKLKKKRFNAKVNVIYDNNLNCTYLGRVKQHGDFDDHIRLSQNGDGVLQSLNIHLKNGNINGVTKFILYSVRSTRSSDEIFASNLLRKLGFMAPRTFYVETEINGLKNVSMFQEKIAKELLEVNKKREGPIYKVNEDIISEDNKLFFLPGGTFAKQININWAKKGKNHLKISKEGLSKINNFFLYYVERPNFYELIDLIRKSKLCITCHGSATHISSSFNNKTIDIIDGSKISLYRAYTSHLKNYNEIIREDSKTTTEKIFNLL